MRSILKVTLSLTHLGAMSKKVVVWGGLPPPLPPSCVQTITFFVGFFFNLESLYTEK